MYVNEIFFVMPLTLNISNDSFEPSNSFQLEIIEDLMKEYNEEEGKYRCDDNITYFSNKQYSHMVYTIWEYFQHSKYVRTKIYLTIYNKRKRIDRVFCLKYILSFL